MVGASAWLSTALGTLGGALLAGMIGAAGWWLNRRRLGRAVALVLFYDVKAVRIDWVESVRNGG